MTKIKQLIEECERRNKSRAHLHYTTIIIQQSDELDNIPITTWQYLTDKFGIKVHLLSNGDYMLEKSSSEELMHQLILRPGSDQHRITSRSKAYIQLLKDYAGAYCSHSVSSYKQDKKFPIASLRCLPDEADVVVKHTQFMGLNGYINLRGQELSYELLTTLPMDSRLVVTKATVENRVIQNLTKIRSELGMLGTPYPMGLHNALVSTRLADNPNVSDAPKRKRIVDYGALTDTLSNLRVTTEEIMISLGNYDKWDPRVLHLLDEAEARISNAVACSSEHERLLRPTSAWDEE